MNVFEDVRSKNALGKQFIELMNQGIHETDVERITNLIHQNLKAMENDVVEFGNAIVDMVNAGEFKETGVDSTWEMKSLSFTLRSRVGHFMVVTLNAEGGHEFFLSLDNNTIELYNVDIKRLCDLVKSYNYLELLNTGGQRLVSWHVDTPNVNPRENE